MNLEPTQNNNFTLIIFPILQQDVQFKLTIGPELLFVRSQHERRVKGNAPYDYGSENKCE
jgi:hypothetical protein